MMRKKFNKTRRSILKKNIVLEVLDEKVKIKQ